MKNKNYEGNFGDAGDYKEGSGVKSAGGSKFDHDLFDETKAVPNKVIRVKRTNSPNGGEKWKIIEDGNTVFVMGALQVSKKECIFLRSPEGFSFLIGLAKQGALTVKKIKDNLKEILK